MIQVDTESSESLIDQLVRSIKQAVASGQLSPEQELPSARQLSGDLDIHWNTVARAYRQLASEGILLVAHGRKTCVKKGALQSDTPKPEAIKNIREGIRDILTRARLAGVDFPAVSMLLKEEISAWK